MATRARGSISGGGLFDLLAPGLYAWGVTVAGPVSQRFAPLGSRIFALVAVVALISGAVLAASAPAVAKIIGVWVFLGACVAAWAFAGPLVGPVQLDPVQGALGSVGWFLFAIAWAAPTPSPRDPSEVSHTPIESPPRQTMPWAMPFVLCVVALAAAVPMVLAWWVESTERALFAHAISLAAALVLIAYASDMFDPRKSTTRAKAPRNRPPLARLSGAMPSLAALLGLLLLGASYALLR